MVNFSPDLLSICKSYNLEPNQVILAFAVAAGAPIADAYIITHHCKSNTTQEQAQTLYNALLTSRPALKIIINRIKNKQNPATLKKQEQQTIFNQEYIKQVEDNLTEEQKDEFRTRQGLIEKIITQSTLVSGKDAISALQTLAKLQGFDKPDEQEQAERRRYFLPNVSHCRTCQLMKDYIKAQNDATNEKPSK